MINANKFIFKKKMRVSERGEGKGREEGEGRRRAGSRGEVGR